MTAKTPEIICTIKQYRRRKGLSQTELADKVGVRRQAIYDMESGRYLPNTLVALKIANILGCTVEMLFIPQAAQVTNNLAFLDASPSTPSRLAVAQVRDKLIGIPLHTTPTRPFSLQAADGIFHANESFECFLNSQQLAHTLLMLGCDPALSVLQDIVTRNAPLLRTHNVFASSQKALMTLNEGKAHIAGTHYQNETGNANVEAAQSLAAKTNPLIIALGIQEEGLMVASGNPLGIVGVESLVNPHVRFVNREEGAALRKLLISQLQKKGIPPTAVPTFDELVFSHSEGALRITSNLADAALGPRVVAQSFGLDFVPLSATRSDLVIPADLQDEQSVAILLNILQSKELQQALSALPGYDASLTGTIILKQNP